ncbi:MAG: hypothetical protein JWO38_2156 [Gemmataceae bacterium]|nr:hypothetical protein [Gemmataceae bacterium]
MPNVLALPPPRPDLLALLNAVKAEPDDDTPRLVLADWLQEQPDPADVARGEWLRALVERDRLSGNDPRRADLFSRSLELWRGNRETWVGLLSPAGLLFPVSEPTFTRGLLYPEVVVTKLVSKAGLAVAQSEMYAWVGGMVFRELIPRQLGMVLKTPLVESLIDLHFIGRAVISFDDFTALARCRRLTGLRSLSTSDVAIRQTGAQAFAGSPSLRNLRRLSLGRADLGDAGFAELCGSSCLNDLRSLDVTDNGLSIHSARAFADSDRLPALTALDLSGNRIGPDGTLILVAYPPAGRLTLLGLRSNGVADYGVEAICRQPHLTRLTLLDLSDNLLTNRAAVALAAAEHLKSLEMLGLTHNQIGDEGARALADSPHLTGLRDLNLRSNPIGQNGADALRERFGTRVTMD